MNKIIQSLLENIGFVCASGIFFSLCLEYSLLESICFVLTIPWAHYSIVNFSVQPFLATTSYISTSIHSLLYFFSLYRLSCLLSLFPLFSRSALWGYYSCPFVKQIFLRKYWPFLVCFLTYKWRYFGYLLQCNKLL